MGRYRQKTKHESPRPRFPLERIEGEDAEEERQVRLPVHRSEAIIESCREEGRNEQENAHHLSIAPPDEKRITRGNNNGEQIPHPTDQPINRHTQPHEDRREEEKSQRMSSSPWREVGHPKRWEPFGVAEK